jgi:hypothetical protein
VTFFAYDPLGDIRLFILDWDIAQIEGAVLERWLPRVFERLEDSPAGFVRATAGRLRVAQHAHPQATFKLRGRATRPMRQSVSACKLGG